MQRLFLLLFVSSQLFAHGAPKGFTTKNYGHSFAKGLKRDHKNFKVFKADRPHKLIVPDDAPGIPAKVDLSARVSPPENQGQCGSCWDFSITKALRSAWMLAGNDPGRLSFNYLLNNCGGVVEEYGCGGGDFNAGKNDQNGKGPWLEKQDPYTGFAGSCPKGLSTVATAATWVLVGSGRAAPSFKELAYALSQDHMLSVDVAVCGAWEDYSGGIYDQNNCGVESINHMINLVGHNCETSVDANGNCMFDANGQPINGDGYLIAMNNWGTQWGEGGYMRSRWHVNALADTAMYFTVAAPTPPVPPVPPVPPEPPTPPGPPLMPGWHGFLCTPVLHWMPWCSYK